MVHKANHLLAASMRLMEVGTKAFNQGEDEKAKGLSNNPTEST